MRKIAIIIAVVLGAFIVTRGVYAVTSNQQTGWLGHMSFYNDTEEGSYYRGGCHGRYYAADDDNYTYSWLYNHLNEDDQALVDDAYASALQNVDFTTMTLTEVKETIDQIEADMVQYILDTFDTTPWE